MLLKYSLFVFMPLLTLCFGNVNHAMSKESDKDYQNYMEFYRLPSSEILPELINNLAKHGVFDEDSSRIPLLFFISEVFHKHQDKAKNWCMAFSKAEPAIKYNVGIGVRLSGVPLAEECVRNLLEIASEKEKEKLMNVNPIDPILIKETSAQLVDILWAMFVASGDARFVNRIIDGLVETVNGDRTIDSMAAAWSLRSMAENHQIVKETLIERSKLEVGERKKAIDEILDKLNEKNE